jgi:hypothetical protein
MGLTIRELIAAAVNPKPVKKDIPGLGEIYLRVLTVGEALAAKDEVEEAKRDPLKIAIRGFCRYLVDDQNISQYDATNPEHVSMLSTLPLAILRSVMEAGNQINGIGGVEAAKN